jgi:hypothetical protein
MKSILLLSLSTAVLALLASCSGEEEPKPKSPPAHTADDGHDHGDGGGEHADHGERTAMGRIALGDLGIQVFHLGPIAPGKEADIDLDFETGAKLPESLRGWIGIESGQGSMKMRFEKEAEMRMHGHIDVPSSLPEGSALWIELAGQSGPVRASLALPR